MRTGPNILLNVMDVVHERLGDGKYRLCPLLKPMIAAGHLEHKRG